MKHTEVRAMYGTIALIQAQKKNTRRLIVLVLVRWSYSSRKALTVIVARRLAGALGADCRASPALSTALSVQRSRSTRSSRSRGGNGGRVLSSGGHRRVGGLGSDDGGGGSAASAAVDGRAGNDVALEVLVDVDEDSRVGSGVSTGELDGGWRSASTARNSHLVARGIELLHTCEQSTLKLQ
jgi:hypothetical protein